MISSPSVPVLGLRMRSSRVMAAMDTNETVDRVKVMMRQDSSTYLCRDYLARRITKENASPANDSTEASECPDVVCEDIVDAVCREKMCEWSYRVCDHFHAAREIVAISFSYLDRFIDRCSCDRTAFKLAAMTTLYMATKIFNGRQITISSLAELSRGEFEMSHIAEMEVIILQTLGWRLHPPTVQCFINELSPLLPSRNGLVTAAILQRATFFAELALYDYSFVARERSLIAIAALLNAMEGMDESTISKAQQMDFLESLNKAFGLRYHFDLVEMIRNRLWYVYSMSAQYKEDDVIAPHTIKESPGKIELGRETSSQVSQSPVSVAHRQ